MSATDIVLKFTGKTDAAGRPREFIEGAPARDLTEHEVKELKSHSPELVKQLTHERPGPEGKKLPALYKAVEKTSASKPAAKKTTASTATSEAEKAKRRERDRKRKERTEAAAADAVPETAAETVVFTGETPAEQTAE